MDKNFPQDGTPLKTNTELWALRFLALSRLGHLATSTKIGTPHVVPVCFAFDSKSIYSSIDLKPKRSEPSHLRRVVNIMENPKVSLVVDSYSEDWRRLQYVIVEGEANIIRRGREHRHAVSLLRRKYRQYRSMRIEQRPIVKIRPKGFVAWSYRLAQSKRRGSESDAIPQGILNGRIREEGL